MTTTRAALVTGGGGGLGAATAERLRADGLKVTTLDLDGADVCADVCADVTDEQALRRVADEVGPVDILVNSAGIVGPNKPLTDTTPEEWRRVLDVNVLGTVNTMRTFVPGMRGRGWGRVVNFASMADKDGNPNLSVYSASKAAVIALTKSAGKELATTGVLVNVITPAVIATHMNASTAPDVLAHITGLIPMNRIGRPEEVAELVAFLASDRVSFSTGAVYDISGGRATYGPSPGPLAGRRRLFSPGSGWVNVSEDTLCSEGRGYPGGEADASGNSPHDWTGTAQGRGPATSFTMGPAQTPPWDRHKRLLVPSRTHAGRDGTSSR